MSAGAVFLIVLASLLILISLIGCVIPGVPGTPLAWAGILTAFFIERSSIGWTELIVTGAVTIAVEIINNFVPSLFTAKAGGSRAGSIGSTVGVFAGLLTGSPMGIILGPFLGALVGELIKDRSDIKRALRSACWAFLGFIVGSGLRLITCAVFAMIFIKSFF